MTDVLSPDHVNAAAVVVRAMERVDSQNPHSSISDWAHRCIAATAIASQALLDAGIAHSLAIGGYRIAGMAVGRDRDIVWEVTPDNIDRELQGITDRVAWHTWVVLSDGAPVDASLLATAGHHLLPPFMPCKNAWADYVLWTGHPAFDVIALEPQARDEGAAFYHAKTALSEIALAEKAIDRAHDQASNEVREAQSRLALGQHRLAWIRRLAVVVAPRVAQYIEQVSHV